MYRTSYSIRILGAVFGAAIGLGFVATAGGALREERALPSAEALRVVQLEPVVIRLHQPPQVAAGCEQKPKAAL